MKKSNLFILLGFFSTVLAFSSVANEAKSSFNPKGKDVFVLGKIKDADYDTYYKNICRTLPKETKYTFRAACEDDRLYYSNNVGKRFIFTGVTSKSPFGDIAKEIILEDGQSLYLIYTTNDFGPAYVQPANKDDFKEIDGFKPGPIYPGSKTMIAAVNMGEELTYTLVNRLGPKMNKAQLSFLRSIADRYQDNGPRIADLLASHVFEYDDFDQRVVVYGDASQGRHTFWSLRLVITDNGDIQPLIVIHYRSKDWLFASKYSISADDLRWSSSDLDFKRRHEDGVIYEWHISQADDLGLSLARKISKSEKAVVRFRGKNSNFDHELSKTQKSQLASLLELYDLLMTRPKGVE